MTAARRFDLVVLYRKTFPNGTARALRRMARRLVYEYDDAVYLPAPSEPQGTAAQRRYHRNFRSTIAVADLVIAGNRQLSAAAVERPTAVLPTGVDLEVFRAAGRVASRDDCVFGWIGTAENLPEWRRLIPAFLRVVAAHPRVRFKLISDREPAPCGLPVEFERFTIAREAACLSGVDVGLMPLDRTPWNRGKCSVKALQCMALGLPVVVSPVGMNREIVEPQVSGLFASSEDEWVAALGRLAASPDLREQMGRAARRVVEQRYALRDIAARLVDLIEGLL
jgi:glycosyltransferase involved in cell wall biosynthesis